MSSSLQSVSIDTLKVGAELQSPIYGHGETKLLGAGVEITEKLLQRLKERGIDRVSIDKDDLTNLQAVEPAAKNKELRASSSHPSPIALIR